MNNPLILVIKNHRGDGCTVRIADAPNGEVDVTMMSVQGTIVAAGRMTRAEVVEWISDRRDW